MMIAAGPIDPTSGVLLRTLWASPQPVALQTADFKLADFNDAYAALMGRSRAALLGSDPISLQPAEDQALARAQRAQGWVPAQVGRTPLALRQRLLDGQGRERWLDLVVSNIAPPGAAARWFSLVHDASGEQQARQGADRAELELAQWFELGSEGMLVYDSRGFIVRHNRAFEELVGSVPEQLDQAAPALQALLGWHEGALHPALRSGAGTVQTQGMLDALESSHGNGPARHLGARLACVGLASPQPPAAQSLDPAATQPYLRVLAVVHDRSAEEDRELARLEMGMLMDTASIGVATYDPARGWLGGIAPVRKATAPADSTSASKATTADEAARSSPASGALLGIGRDLVEPASLPEFERLQKALRSGERAEVRYAVRHPEMGLRWLLTRVEPAALAGGRNTTSIVTLDVTEQEAAQRRNEQLLRELGTILDSSTAGIAYLRGPALVRCNRRFERMLGFEAGAAAGASLGEIFARSIEPAAAKAADTAALNEPSGSALQPATSEAAIPTPSLSPAQRAQRSLDQGQAFEIELSRNDGAGGLNWYSLSLRRADLPEATPVGEGEAVAVLTDITRLKLQQAELEQLLRDRELMFSLSDVGIAYQRGARIERANQAMAEITGWDPSGLRALDPAELYENTRECVEFEARISQSLREKGRFGGERKLRRRDGRLLWVQVAVRPVHQGDPEAGVICSFVNVDERMRARHSLAQQAERTRSMLNSVLVGIVTVSERGIEWMNRSARRMFAGELADFAGKSISLVATPQPDHPLRRTDWPQRLRAREGDAETFECQLRGRDGREFWVVGSAVLSGAGGAEREVTFALLDIERRRQAEVSIAQAQASLRRVIETAPLAIAIFDARTLRVQQLNQTAGEFFGRPLLALPGSSLAEMCEPRQAAALQRWLQAVADPASAASDAATTPGVHEWHEMAQVSADENLGSDEQDPASSRLPGAGRSTRPLRVWDCRIAPLDEAKGGDAEGGKGPVTQLLLVASDVTGQREAEQARLQAALDQREVLVREVHHRIKNNLQGVAGLLQQNAVRRPELSNELNEAVGQVQAIAQVHGLQVGGGGGHLAVAALLRAIAQSVQRTFGQTIEVELEGRVPHLLPEGESIPVALTVNELLTNAIKHGRRGPDRTGDAAVRCTLIGRDEGVCIRIAGTAQLAAGFDLKRVPAGVSGLGLVRALLPRRSASFSLVQQGHQVVAEIELRPPSVRWPQSEQRGEFDQRQLAL